MSIIRCEECHEIIHKPVFVNGQYICNSCLNYGKSNGGIAGESCTNKSIKHKEIKEGWEDDRIAKIYEDYINI